MTVHPMVSLMMMMMMNCFFGMVDEQHLALFPTGTIVRDPRHHESLTRCQQDVNQHRT